MSQVGWKLRTRDTNEQVPSKYLSTPYTNPKLSLKVNLSRKEKNKRVVNKSSKGGVKVSFSIFISIANSKKSLILFIHLRNRTTNSLYYHCITWNTCVGVGNFIATSSVWSPILWMAPLNFRVLYWLLSREWVRFHFLYIQFTLLYIYYVEY